MKEGQSKIWRVDPLNNKNMSRRHSHLNLGDLLKCGVLVEYFKIGLPRVGFFCLFVCLFVFSRYFHFITFGTIT
jgi:hypothetical protein